MRYIFCLLIYFVSMNDSYAISVGSACETSWTITGYPIYVPKISIDPNAAVGTIFYRKSLSFPNGYFKCTQPVTASVLIKVEMQTSPVQGYVTSSAFGTNNRIWKTNIAGVGVLLVTGDGSDLGTSRSIPRRVQSTGYTDLTFDYGLPEGTASMVTILLVKYDAIPAGTQTVTFDSSTVPEVALTFTVSNSTDTNKLPNTTGWYSKLRVSSPTNMILVNSTCTAPMVPVDMGEHHLSEFSTEDSRLVGPWVDASINLTNCPVFYGTGGQPLNETTQANTMKVTVTPGNATTSNIGIMPVNSGVQAATNVGIQMGWGTEMNKTLLNFASGKASNTYALTSTQGSTFKIPLVARYRQINAGTIGGGNANGQMTYVIDYY